MAIHHGGLFSKDEYVDGRLNYVDECSILHFDQMELASVMVRLKYRREICEFYYCHPAHNHACHGNEVGHPLSPLLDEEHFTRFLCLATKFEKLIHMYGIETTVAKAKARHKRDQMKYLKDYINLKSKVVIEEIDEPPMVIPKQKPKKKMKVNGDIPLLGWYERDIEFEQYLEDSLVKEREKWRMEDAEKEGSVVKNLMDEFPNVDQVLKVKFQCLLLLTMQFILTATLVL